MAAVRVSMGLRRLSGWVNDSFAMITTRMLFTPVCVQGLAALDICIDRLKFFGGDNVLNESVKIMFS